MHLDRIVEVAKHDELYRVPLNPYTAALLSPVQLADPEAEAKRIRPTVTGEVPSRAQPAIKLPLPYALPDDDGCMQEAESGADRRRRRPRRRVLFTCAAERAAKLRLDECAGPELIEEAPPRQDTDAVHRPRPLFERDHDVVLQQRLLLERTHAA